MTETLLAKRGSHPRRRDRPISDLLIPVVRRQTHHVDRRLSYLYLFRIASLAAVLAPMEAAGRAVTMPWMSLHRENASETIG
jgi:hypothetical protein